MNTFLKGNYEEMTNNMAEVGADVALVITPSYYKSGMKDQHFLNHFKKVADKSKIWP